jgi:hypothetical protein
MDERAAIPSKYSGLRPFQKGQSGNPGGRPAIESRIRRLAQRNSRRAIVTLVRLLRSKNERVQFMAANALLDRAVGKPAQAVALTGADGEPLRLTATVTDPIEAARIYAAVLGGAIDVASVAFDPTALAPPAPRMEPVGEVRVVAPVVDPSPVDSQTPEADSVVEVAQRPDAPQNVVDIWSRLAK